MRVLEAAWGEAISPEDVARALGRDPGIRAVFVQLSESSTGARHDLEGSASVTRDRSGTLLVVDAISGAGAMPLLTEAWGVDLVVVGSQKTLSLPPGLAFLAVSPKAWGQIEGCGAPRFYFDLLRERKGQAKGSSAFTPGIAHVVALRAALQVVEDLGGVDGLVVSAATLAAMTRAAAGALGLPLLSAAPRRGRPHGDRGGRDRQGPQGRLRRDGGRGPGPLDRKDLPHRPPRLLRCDGRPGPARRPRGRAGRLGHRFTQGAGLAAAQEVVRDRIEG